MKKVKAILFVVFIAVIAITVATGGMGLLLAIAYLPYLIVLVLFVAKIALATLPFWLLGAVARRSSWPQRNNVAYGAKWWALACLLPFGMSVLRSYSREPHSQFWEFDSFASYATAALLTLPVGIIAFFCRKREYERLVRGRRQARLRE
jgi:hypothetical protein